jgi:dienelactone hydrolase
MCACSADRREYRSVDSTVQSRGVAIPVTFVSPEAGEGDIYPLVVMAHGHGGSRDEGDGYRDVAERLAQRGVASIRMDFPGCGDSTESFAENNLSNMLADLQSARDYAVSQPGIDEDRIGLLGFSMGGRLVALLSEIDPRYKVMATWAPAVANSAERENQSLGGPDVYEAMKQEALENGFTQYTTQWGAELILGHRWFTDLEQSTPLASIAKFPGPLLVIYGDEDDAVPPSISEAAIKAAESSSEVLRHVMHGVGHDLGFYSDRPAVALEVVNTTVDFLAERL